MVSSETPHETPPHPLDVFAAVAKQSDAVAM